MIKKELEAVSEVWLSLDNYQITCHVVAPDETRKEFGVDSLSLLGAMREMTAWMIDEGYEPAGRWINAIDDNPSDRHEEVYRRFTAKAAK